MISIEKRREIFKMYFIEFNSVRKISRELNISRSTLSKIINEYKDRLKELNLLEEDNLSIHIDLIVLEPKQKISYRKRLIVSQEHIDILEELIKYNEKVRSRYKNPKEFSNLPDDFYTEIKKRKLKTITHSTYYKLAREIKDKLGIPYTKRNRTNKKNKKNINTCTTEIKVTYKK